MKNLYIKMLLLPEAKYTRMQIVHFSFYTCQQQMP